MSENHYEIEQTLVKKRAGFIQTQQKSLGVETGKGKSQTPLTEVQ